MESYKPMLVGSCSATSALPRQTLVTTAMDALRWRILYGELQEGESLNQVAIARGYAISRIPFREAMRQLEVEGLLVFQPDKGAVVSELSLSEIGEVIDLRARIEPDLISRATAHLTITDSEEPDQIHEEYKAARKKGEASPGVNGIGASIRHCTRQADAKSRWGYFKTCITSMSVTQKCRFLLRIGRSVQRKSVEILSWCAANEIDLLP